MDYNYIIIFILSVIIVYLYLKLEKERKRDNKKIPNVIEASNKDKKRIFNKNVPQLDILSDNEYKNIISKFNKESNKLLIPLGVDLSNNLEMIDLNELDNILVLGTTGGGKSVLLNEIVASIILNYTKDEVKFVTIDSSIVELSSFNGIPHYIKNAISDMEVASKELELVLKEIERRKNNPVSEHLILIIDDLYDLAYNQEKYIHNLLEQIIDKSKGTNVHLVLATDTPDEYNLPVNLKNKFKTMFYLTLSPGTYNNILQDDNLTQEEIDYMMTIGNSIYINDNVRKQIKILEVPDKDIKEIVKYYLL